jgi:gliding motility-associated-like protein
MPVRYFLFILFFLLPVISMAQLSAPGMNALRYTTYPSAPGVHDPVFIYCNSSGTQKGTIQAVSPGGTGPFNYSWYKWNDITKSFSIFLKTDTAVASSTSANLDEGGYKVRITDADGYDKSLVGWIFLDSPLAKSSLQNYTCDYVALSGKAAVDTFYYKDPADGIAIRLKNAFAFTWSSDPTSIIPYPSIDLNPVTYTPPLEDVTYKLQVIDSFLCTSVSSFPFTSITVKADFTVDPDNGEAPLEVTFTNNSVRGSTYRWEFGDDSISELQNPLPHTYYRPGDYSVKLTVTSNLLCVDSLRFDKISVDPSELSIPNVFTPDGDGINDYFIVESKSLRSISVEIFSRSGLMVYSFSGEGESLKDWKGWDGNVNNSSSKATPGVYFYIIRALGWDDIIYNGKQYRGFLYLYR